MKRKRKEGLLDLERSRSAFCLADDFSGLCETASLSSLHGVETALFISPEVYFEWRHAQPDRSVRLVDFVNLGCREMEGLDAYSQVRNLLDGLQPGPEDPVYVKLDSAARGPVGFMLKAVMETWPSSKVPVMFGNPGQNRVVRDGVLYVEGVPLHESSFRLDPIHPARSSDVAFLLSEAGGLPVFSEKGMAGAGEGGVIILDCEGAVDVVRASKTWSQCPVAAGSAPFGAELLRNWSGAVEKSDSRFEKPRFHEALLVTGSCHPAVDRLAAELETLGGSIQIAGEGNRIRRLPALIRTTRAKGDPEAVMSTLRSEVRPVLESNHPTSLFLIGGTTAKAVLEVIGVGSGTPHPCSLGIGAFRPHSTPVPSLQCVFVKPGSYVCRGMWESLYEI